MSTNPNDVMSEHVLQLLGAYHGVPRHAADAHLLRAQVLAAIHEEHAHLQDDFVYGDLASALDDVEYVSRVLSDAAAEYARFADDDV